MEHPKHILARHGLDAKKSLGQNFLFDDSILAAIVSAASTQAQDNVLEIGAGLGALTQHLAAVAGRVVAVEIDQRLLPALRENIAPYTNVDVIHADILARDPQSWFPGQPYKVVANVPYYITGAILEHFLGSGVKPHVLVVTVQKEVAARMTAGPGDMTLLAVSVQVFGEVEVVREISAGSFWPRPDVDSAVVRFRLRQEPVLTPADESAFFRVVRVGFSQKRKQLQKNLRALGFKRAEIIRLMQDAGIAPQRRAETLSIAEWLSLYRAIQQAQSR